MNYKNMQKKAFTLAELIIVMVIISFVATISVNMLNKSYQKKEAAIRLQKAYEDISKAVANGVIENGEVDTWVFPDYYTNGSNMSEFFDTYLSSLRIVKRENWGDVMKRNSLKYKAISGKNEDSFTVLSNQERVRTTAFTLASGAIIIAHNFYSDGGHEDERRPFWVDTNGIKPPNTIGKDMFPFAISRDGRVLLISWNDKDSLTESKAFKSREELMTEDTSDHYQCNSDANARGYWCGALIQKDGWKIKSDYPW